jgi:hypothetical protein
MEDHIQSTHFAGLLEVRNVLSADTGFSRQTEGHSFGDHPIIGSVSVTPSTVIEDSIVLFCVFMIRVSQSPTSLRAEHSCETSRFPHFLDNWLTDGGGEVFSLTRRQSFSPRKIPGIHFC